MNSNSQLNVSSLFRSLKPESANAASIHGDSLKKAQQRWPILQSLPPTKWPLTPSLNETEKNARRIQDSADQNLPLLRKPASLVPDSDSRIAEGLDRLFTHSKVIETTNPISLEVPAQVSAQLNPVQLNPVQLSSAHPIPFPLTRQPVQEDKPSLFRNPISIPASSQIAQIEKPEFKSLFSTSTAVPSPTLPATEQTLTTSQTTPEQAPLKQLLMRIEESKIRRHLQTQAANQTVTQSIKPPGFFSRLGKR
jgi:hypothetical protein